MVRRFSALLLAFLALLATGGCAQTQQAWESTKQTVSGWFSFNPVSADGVAAKELPTLVIAKSNVVPKIGPDAKAKPAGALRMGDRVARLEVQGNWVRVWIPEGGQVAWVNREAVQPDTGENSVSGTVPFSALLPFRVAAAQANLREAPDPKANLVAELKQGTELRFLDVRGGWLKVADPAGRQMGWVAQSAVGRSS
ncbi:MAG: SH3 domain-containing protein [candidate division NC10 bacterium]|nr:SH3 domain-containing protein [candidate division NC10 bacterium]